MADLLAFILYLFLWYKAPGFMLVIHVLFFGAIAIVVLGQ